MTVTSLPRRGLFCDAVVRSDQVLVVHDTLEDPLRRSSENVRLLGIRFYAGAPLIMPDGTRLGAFGIADVRPRAEFSPKDRATLVELARAVVGEIELARQLADNRGMVAALALRQEIAAIAASAPTFRLAVEGVLQRTGRSLGAALCSVVEVDRPGATFRFVAGYNSNEAMKDSARSELSQPSRPISHLHCAPALLDDAVVDCRLDDPALLATYPLLAKAAAIGARRMISFPLTIAERRFGLSVGFKSAQVSEATLAFCDDFSNWLAPLLQGHVREQALAHANARLDRSNRALRALDACNQAMAQARTEPALIQAVCDLAVTIGHYSAAWVGMAETDAAASLRPVATAGIGLDRIRSASISWADTPYGRGPSGTCVRENRPVIVHDYLTDPRMIPWHDPSDQKGRTSIISLPLHDDAGSCFGCLSLHVNDRLHDGIAAGIVFDAEEVGLLTRLAAALAYGIGSLRSRAARDAAITISRATERRLARLLEASPTIVYALERPHPSASWELTEISANLERLYGHVPAAARIPHWWLAHIHPDDRAQVSSGERRLLEDGRSILRYRFARSDGTYRWIRDERTLIGDSPDGPARIVGAWVDITEKYEADQAIHRLAFFDTLTGLPNRGMLRRYLETALTSTRANGRFGALLFIDLVGFEVINDLHGHATGDAVLGQVAQRLQTHLRDGDMVARLGGDKFAFLLADLADALDCSGAIAQRLAEKLLRALAEPVIAGGHDRHVTADIGIALFPHGTATVSDIFREADIAVHQAVSSERAPIVFFESAMHERMTQRHLIEGALRDALEHQRFEVWLQSQVDPQGAVTGAEALIRLRLPDGTILPPEAFIRIAEETGMVFAMGRWMLQAACRIIAARAASGRRLRVSINVSPLQFHDSNFVADIEAALTTTGADPHDLMIEITENLLIDRIEPTTRTLATLADLGIQFSVDDFGTGYSSLGYLQNLPIAEIKIDRSFIRHLPDNQRDATLADAILSLSRNLGLTTVAEGVETEAQAAFLRAHHCNTMQGFLFGHPQPAQMWLEQHGTTGYG